MKYQISELISLLSPIDAINCDDSLPNWSFSTDSRHMHDGGWFIGLVGDTHDGNEYWADAVANGAEGLILSPVSPVKRVRGFDKMPTLIVKDTLKAYQQIANYHLQKINNPIVIGITGSNGKTTTKEILKLILQREYDLIATKANENNEIGVPKTILKATSAHNLIILEMGMRGEGQIKELTQIAQPQYALITNVGSAHIELLGSIDAIRDAKAEIFTGIDIRQEVFLPKGQFSAGVLSGVLNNYHEYSQPKHLSYRDNKMYFTYKEEEYAVHTINKAIINNICGIIDLCKKLNISKNNIIEGLLEYSPQKGRGQLHNINNNIIIDETYNASPESVRAISKSMSYLQDYHKVLILGEIAELGEHTERLMSQLAQDIEEYYDEIWLLESYSNKYFRSNKAKIFSSKDTIPIPFSFGRGGSEGRGEAIVLKASRIAKLEELLLKFLT